jgi:hypothetical protein
MNFVFHTYIAIEFVILISHTKDIFATFAYFYCRYNVCEFLVSNHSVDQSNLWLG